MREAVSFQGFFYLHNIFKVGMWAQLLHSCLTLRPHRLYSLQGSSVHEGPQARILEWVAMPSSRGSFRPRIKPTSLMSPALAGGVLTTSTTKSSQVEFLKILVSESHDPQNLVQLVQRRAEK